MKKIIFAVVIAIIGTLLSLGALKVFNIPSDYLTYDRIVEKVERNDQNIYFEFVDDYKDAKKEIHNKYSFTEYSGVKASYVEDNIKVGDHIKITIEDTSGNFKYILLQKVEKNNVVIFDSIEHYQQHNMNLRMIFIPSIIIISLFLIIMCFIKLYKNNTISSFVIRLPKWMLGVFIFSTLLGITFPIMFTILLAIGSLNMDTYMYSIPFYIFLIVGIIGIISYLFEYIKYDSNYYYIHRMFKKTKKIENNEIKKILIDRTKRKGIKSGLYDENNQKIMILSMSIMYFISNDLFVKSLHKNGVRFVSLELDEKGKEIEKPIVYY